MARILIVEDELLIIEDLKNKLRRLGHSVTGHATTGDAAVQKAIDTQPELVLMDVRLRGSMNGIEAARRIRELQKVPVIYVTAHAAAVAEHVDQQQHQFVLTKPFSMTELKAVVTAACGEDPTAPRSDS
jgi:two-component system, cell cycle sensor histidine kinase and response regulator CckA